jgi:hypothetical protein
MQTNEIRINTGDGALQDATQAALRADDRRFLPQRNCLHLTKLNLLHQRIICMETNLPFYDHKAQAALVDHVSQHGMHV